MRNFPRDVTRIAVMHRVSAAVFLTIAAGLVSAACTPGPVSDAVATSRPPDLTTRLADAVADGDLAAARAALAAGDDPNAIGRGGYRPLSIAVLRDDKEAVRILLEAGAEPNFVHPSKSWVSVLRAREVYAHAKILSRDPDLVAGQCLLALAAESAMMRLLVDGGADPNCEGHLGDTPLRQAVYDSNSDLVIALIRVGADPNRVPANAQPVLLEALSYGRIPVAEVLLRAGADPTKTNGFGRTALHYAAAMPGGRFIERLVATGVNVDAQDNNGDSPLMIAARDGYVEAATALLAAKADPELRNIRGLTARDQAVAGGHTRVVELLDETIATR